MSAVGPFLFCTVIPLLSVYSILYCTLISASVIISYYLFSPLLTNMEILFLQYYTILYHS